MTFTTRIFKPAQNRLSKQKLLSTKPRKGFKALAKSTKAADIFKIWEHQCPSRVSSTHLHNKWKLPKLWSTPKITAHYRLNPMTNDRARQHFRETRVCRGQRLISRILLSTQLCWSEDTIGNSIFCLGSIDTPLVGSSRLLLKLDEASCATRWKGAMLSFSVRCRRWWKPVPSLLPSLIKSRTKQGWNDECEGTRKQRSGRGWLVLRCRWLLLDQIFLLLFLDDFW